MREGGRSERPRRERRPSKPLDATRLSELALFYVGRFATSRAKLARYLERKIRERGWEDEVPADVEALVARIAGYGYVDDASYATSTARGLVGRGYGSRRIGSALHAAGIVEEDASEARAIGEAERVAAALKLARRRRWGPYAAEAVSDPAARERMIGAFLRAGHDARLARAIVALKPGEGTDGLE